MKNCHDVVIVGAGAAGVTAGIVLARTGIDVVIVDAGHPRNAPAAAMHGFIAQDGVSPLTFLATGRDEFTRFGGAFVSGQVTTSRPRPDGRFELRLDDGTVLATRAVLVATGLTDAVPTTPGLRELWGTFVHHCLHCHGYEVRGQRIVFLGGEMTATTIQQAALARRYSDQVTLCTNGMAVPETERDRLEAFGVRILNGIVTGLDTREGRLESVRLADGGTLACDAAFVVPRPRPNDAILRELGCADGSVAGWIDVDPMGATSVPGVWAAGNVVNPRAQVIIAAGAGSAAAIAITDWLLEKDVAAAARALPAR